MFSPPLYIFYHKAIVFSTRFSRLIFCDGTEDGTISLKKICSRLWWSKKKRPQMRSFFLRKTAQTVRKRVKKSDVMRKMSPLYTYPTFDTPITPLRRNVISICSGVNCSGVNCANSNCSGWNSLYSNFSYSKISTPISFSTSSGSV